MDHFFQEFEADWAKFGEIDEVFIEIQPPTGIVSVEALIFKRYRSKVKQISPNAMHKWFNISELDYEHRKAATVQHALRYLGDKSNFTWLERQHDQADALLLFLFEMHRRKEKLVKQMDQEERAARIDKNFKRLHDSSLDEFFEHFRHHTNKKIKL